MVAKDPSIAIGYVYVTEVHKMAQSVISRARENSPRRLGNFRKFGKFPNAVWGGRPAASLDPAIEAGTAAGLLAARNEDFDCGLCSILS